MASMRNGSGDEYSIVFSAAGALLRDEGYVVMMPQRGSFVADRENWPAR
ncbi:hypothetical protein ABT061_16565 [Streptosporangium sp. NPDC002544]